MIHFFPHFLNASVPCRFNYRSVIIRQSLCNFLVAVAIFEIQQDLLTFFANGFQVFEDGALSVTIYQ